MRGTKSITHGSSTDPRITPACAGNSFPPAFMGAAGGDHPRVCGEQPQTGRERKWKIGSPPRVRGTGRPFGILPIQLGITPACAGNRVPMATNTARSEDHPRVCGEQFFAWARCKFAVGITPACAGNSQINLSVV